MVRLVRPIQSRTDPSMKTARLSFGKHRGRERDLLMFVSNLGRLNLIRQSVTLICDEGNKLRIVQTLKFHFIQQTK